MPTIQTALFSILAPSLFEKALWMGQLIRLERMDRAQGEASFAEGNFFVGHVAEEDLGVPADGPAKDILEALWGRYLQGEQPESSASDAILSERRQPRSREALLKLAATDWRPEVGHLLRIELLEGEGSWVYARFLLEFDWTQRATYEPLGRSILSSLVWKQAVVSAEALEVQKRGVWSCFDAMEPAAREAIALRYREILGQVPRVPDGFEREAIRTLDLRALDPHEITVAALDSAMVAGDYGSRAVLLRTAFLSDGIEFTCHLDGGGDSHVFGQDTVAVVRALQALSPEHHARAGELLWEHCRLCFDATDYGAGAESNEDHFGIHGPEDAFAAAGKATIDLTSPVRGRLHEIFALDFYPPWEDEHGCSLVVRDGELVGWSDPGAGVQAFRPDADRG